MSRGISLAALTMLAFIFGGCAVLPAPAAPVRPYPFPAEEALARIDSRCASGIFLKAVARTAINTETARYPLKLAVLVERPSSLRLEAIPVIGLPNFFLSAHRGLLSVYLPQQGEYYQGKAAPENLSRFFPIPLSAPELAALLTGCRPASPATTTPELMRGYQEGKTYRLDINSRNPERRQSLWIDPDTGNLIRFEKAENAGEKILNAHFEAFALVDGYALPHRIRVKWQDTAAYSVELHYESVALEKPTSVHEALFVLPAPVGVKITPLDK